MPRTIDSVLAEIDPLSYRQRQRLLASRAREMAADGRLAVVAAEAANAFEREIVLLMGIVVRDTGIVTKALNDEDWRLRSMAIDAVRHVPIEAGVLVSLITDAPAEMRKRIYRLVRGRRLTDLADALFAAVVERYGESEAATLLAACSRDLVERELPRLVQAVPNWRVLALAHPETILAMSRQDLASATKAERQRWWWRSGSGVLALAEQHPQAIFELIERYPVESYPYGIGPALACLARWDTPRLFALLDRPEQSNARRALTQPCLLRTIRSLGVDWLAGFLCRHTFGRDMRDMVLAELPPSRRAELFDRTQQHFQQVGVPTPEATLRVLPHEVRIREARRSLDLPRVREDKEQTLRYTAFMPFAAAEDLLRHAAGRHLAEERAVGYELLIQCAARAHDPGVPAQVLASLTRLRNEQDPVRARAIGAISAWPVRLFGAGDAAMLAEITREAVAARDSSHATRHALSQLAVRLLAHRSQVPELLSWALSTLDLLFGTGRLPHFGQLDQTLRRGQEQEFFAAVQPWIESGMARANYEPLFSTARSLGRRGRNLAGLQVLLAEAINGRNTMYVNRQAIELWLDDPAHRADRVESVLLDDASTVALDVVWRTISTVRTDLLDLVLNGKGPTGKHLPAGVRWVPAHAPGVERWLPRQHRRYLDLLTRVAADAGTDLSRRANAIRSAARIPAVGWSLVEKYCGSPNVVLDEAALGALIWTDQPARALPILLSHVDDDRARVAVYGLSRATRFVAPSVIRPILVQVLNNARKITSRKEAIRLLSAVAPHDAMRDVYAAWQPDQHRDVRVAIVHMARTHLGEAASWLVLQEATTDTEVAVARTVTQISPHLTPAEYRVRYAALIGQACRHSDPEVARAAWAAYPRWAAWAPTALTDIADAVRDMTTLTSWRPAMEALIQLLDEGMTVRDLAPVFDQLSSLSDTDSPNAGVDRDLPARQRLLALVHQLVNWTKQQDHLADQTDVHTIGSMLATRPEYLQAGLELMTWSAPIQPGLRAYLDRIATMVQEHPLTAQWLSDTLLARLNWERNQLSIDLLQDAANELAATPSLESGLLALTLVRCMAESPSGWSADRDRALLRNLRQHAHPDVRVLALNVVTSPE